MDDSCPTTGEPICRCNNQHPNHLQPKPKDTLRKLFTDHAVYTHEFIKSYLDNLPETELLKTRLLANQTEIGQYFGMYLGDDVGTTIGSLFTEHIIKAAGLVTALNTATTTEEVEPYIDELADNVRDVAIDVSKLSDGKLSEEEVGSEFAKHNLYVVQLAALHKNKQYEEEIKTYDEYYTHMLSFSDMLCYGLLKSCDV